MVVIDDALLVQELVNRGILSRQQIRNCLDRQLDLAMEGQPKSLQEIILDRGLITGDLLGRVIREAVGGESTNLSFNRSGGGRSRPRGMPPRSGTHAAYDPNRQKRFGNYIILGEIARGAMGIIFRARHVESDQIVALKVMQAVDDHADHFLARFKLEARAAARLNHPNIVKVHDSGMVGDAYYFTMELAEGPTFDKFLKQNTNPDLDWAVERLIEISDAVHYAHEEGIIHRDLKLSNVILSPGGIPKVVDFGLAKFEDGLSRLTQTGDLLGTPYYMSPEQIQGKHRKVDARTDVWALGVMLYRILASDYPFRGPSTGDIAHGILHRPLEFPDDEEIPDDLRDICARAMAKERNDRYPTARDFADDLRRYLGGEVVHGQKSGLVKHILWAAGFLLLVGLPTAAAVLNWGPVESAFEDTQAQLESDVAAFRNRLGEKLQALTQKREPEALRSAITAIRDGMKEQLADLRTRYRDQLSSSELETILHRLRILRPYGMLSNQAFRLFQKTRSEKDARLTLELSEEAIGEAEGKDWDVRLRVAVLKRMTGDIEAAEMLLEPLIEERPDGVRAILELARCHVGTGDLTSARHLLQEADKKEPGSATVDLVLLAVRKADRLWSEGADLWASEVEEDRETALELYFSARTIYRKAARDCAHLLEEEPRLNVSLARSRSLRRLGEWQRATTCLLEAESHAPDAIELRRRLAELLLLQRKGSEARQRYAAMAEEGRPRASRVEGTLGLGRVADCVDRPRDEVLAHYDRALELNPETAEAYSQKIQNALVHGKWRENQPNYRAASLMEMRSAFSDSFGGSMQQTVDRMETILKSVPLELRKNPDILIFRALTARLQNKEGLERKYRELALEVAPHDPDLVNMLAFMLNDPQKAIDSARLARSPFRDWDRLYERARFGLVRVRRFLYANGIDPVLAPVDEKAVEELPVLQTLTNNIIFDTRLIHYDHYRHGRAQTLEYLARLFRGENGPAMRGSRLLAFFFDPVSPMSAQALQIEPLRAALRLSKEQPVTAGMIRMFAAQLLDPERTISPLIGPETGRDLIDRAYYEYHIGLYRELILDWENAAEHFERAYRLRHHGSLTYPPPEGDEAIRPLYLNPLIDALSEADRPKEAERWRTRLTKAGFLESRMEAQRAHSRIRSDQFRHRGSGEAIADRIRALMDQYPEDGLLAYLYGENLGDRGREGSRYYQVRSLQQEPWTATFLMDILGKIGMEVQLNLDEMTPPPDAQPRTLAFARIADPYVQLILAPEKFKEKGEAELERAIWEATRYLHEYPDRGSAWLARGLFHRALGHWDQASRDLEAARFLLPYDHFPYYQTAILLDKTDKGAEAIKQMLTQAVLRGFEDAVAVERDFGARFARFVRRRLQEGR